MKTEIPQGIRPNPVHPTNPKLRSSRDVWRALAYMTDTELRENFFPGMGDVVKLREDLVEIIELNHMKYRKARKAA